MQHPLNSPAFYERWQTAFAKHKIAPIISDKDFISRKRVLDIGCGPGTHFPFLSDKDYCGLDLSSEYVDYASHKFSGRFIAQDATDLTPVHGEKFEAIVINSLFHHLEDTDVTKALQQLKFVSSADSLVYIVDMVWPPSHLSLAAALARLDRGSFVRSQEKLHKLCEQELTILEETRFNIAYLGCNFWHLVFIKGAIK